MLPVASRHLRQINRAKPTVQFKPEALVINLIRQDHEAQLPGVLGHTAVETLLAFAKPQGVDLLVLSALRNQNNDRSDEAAQSLLDSLERRAAALDAVRAEELTRALNAIAETGAEHLIFKGGALAHQLYAAPHLRPRGDTDILVRERDIPRVHHALCEAGYAQAPAPDGRLVSSQRLYTLVDGREVGHSIDLHWHPFNRVRFRASFNFEELLDQSVPLPQAAPSSRAASLTDALQLACVHLLAHHAHEQRLIWLVDIDLIARKLGDTDWNHLEGTVTQRQILSECAAGLQMAKTALLTPIKSKALSSENNAETAIRRMAADRHRWRRLVDDLYNLESWSCKREYLKETLLPGRAFMDARYPGDGPLFIRYLKRLAGRGAKVLTRRQ